MKRLLYILMSLSLVAMSVADVSAQADKRQVRKGNRHFKAAEYNEAEVEYLKALQLDTLSMAANYNLANTFFRQGEYDNAANAYARVEQTAAASAHGADFYYNQGAAAIAQKDWQKAVDAFAKSLLLNPDDLDAKENFIYARKMLQNQQQNQNQDQQQNQDQNQDQQQNQDQNQDQDQQQNQDQNQNQNQNQDQQQDQDQNQDQQQNQNQDQGQQPQITPQAAQQMLQAIQAKEKQTQDKVNKERAAAMRSRQREKNW